MAVKTIKVDLLQRLREHITDDPNSLYMLVKGDLGSGKSWASLSIACGIDPDFIEHKEERIVFSPVEFVLLTASRSLPEGSMIMWDEAQTSMNPKRHMSAINVALNTQLDTMRRDNVGLVFNCPNTIDRALTRNLDFDIETIKIDRGARKTQVKFKYIDHDKTMDKIYRKFCRLIGKGRIPDTLNPLFIPAPDHPAIRGKKGRELIDYYENKRDSFQDDISMKVAKTIIKSYQKEMNLTTEDLVRDLEKYGLTLEDLGLQNKKKAVDTKKRQIIRTLKATDLKYSEVADLTETTEGYVQKIGRKVDRNKD